MKRRPIIGILVHRLANDYAEALVEGAILAANDMNVDLAIFSGRSLKCQLHDKEQTFYEYQNNAVYSYVSNHTLDAVIVSVATLSPYVSKEFFGKFIASFGDVPILTLEEKIDGYHCARISAQGIESIIDHVINDHGKKRIAYVSGPRNNADAKERLEYYKKAIAKNGLQYDESLVEYGDFSEYTEEIVERLLDHKDGMPEAIIFANDNMCRGAYKVLERRGLVPGEDIVITGYDDSSIAISLEPMLTTVKADVPFLGEEAVKMAVRLANGEDIEDLNMPSLPIYRGSCGCKEKNGHFDVLYGKMSSDEFAKQIISTYIPSFDEIVKYSSSLQQITNVISTFIEFIVKKNSTEQDFEVLKETMLGIYKDNFDISRYINDDNLLEIVSVLQKYLYLSEVHYEIKKDISMMLGKYYSYISDRLITTLNSKLASVAENQLLISNITKDMVHYGSDREKGFMSIIKNIKKIGIQSCYIFTFDAPIANDGNELFDAPDELILESYLKDGEICVPEKYGKRISKDDIFNNKYLRSDNQTTYALAPLYFTEDQYGLVIFEMSKEYYQYIYSICSQIDTSIKITGLISELSDSLNIANSRNSMLSKMSNSDELTGIYNRRGFYEYANAAIGLTRNQGQMAILILADLDNLKKINDMFGHDEGDYAIKTAALYLTNSLRSTDVVARFGGDEFAAFALCDSEEAARTIYERIKEAAIEHNKNSEKKYEINLSIGYHLFKCVEDKRIQDYIEPADVELYKDKKNKKENVLK